MPAAWIGAPERFINNSDARPPRGPTGAKLAARALILPFLAERGACGSPRHLFSPRTWRAWAPARGPRPGHGPWNHRVQGRRPSWGSHASHGRGVLERQLLSIFGRCDLSASGVGLCLTPVSFQEAPP